MKWFAILIVVAAFVGCRGRVPVVEGEGEVGEGEGEVVGEGEGDVVGEGEGEVLCAGLKVRCGDRCVDVESDDDNCGVCGDVCADDERCTGGRCNARCVNPRLDVGGTFVGNLPELAGCEAVRYDVDGDGSIDDVCGGFRIVTEPEFAVEDAGVAPPHFFFAADLHAAPGLEGIDGCSVVDEDFAALITFDEPCDLAGNGVADIDDDSDFDVVLKDGRVFEHTADGLVPAAPLPALPGPVTRFRFDEGEALVSWSRERSALVRLEGELWVDVGRLDVGYDVIQLLVIDDGATQTLVVWQGNGVVPNLTLCAWNDLAFSCRLASSSTNLIASPPRDGRFSSRTMGFVVSADGAEVGVTLPVASSEAAPFFVPKQTLIAFDDTEAWFITAATGAVTRHPLAPAIAMPVSARVHHGDTVVDVVVAPNAIVVGPDAFPIHGTVQALRAHPQMPIVWLSISPFPNPGFGQLVALDVDSGATLSTTDEVSFFGALQIVDVDGDGALELLAGMAPTFILDAASGVLLEQRDEFVRFVDVDGVVRETHEQSRGVFDLDGDGVADDVSPALTGVITTGSGVVEVGDAHLIIPGPGRRQVSLYDAFSGAMTFDLLCD